ncbi:MAG: hypothetical protein R3E79_31025 [Caldilineaceae bacterium]
MLPHLQPSGAWRLAATLGNCNAYIGNAAEAHRLLDESLGLCDHLGNQEILARIYGFLAEVALWNSDLPEAERWLRQSLAAEAKLPWYVVESVDVLFVAACLAVAQQVYQLAAQRFGLAEQVYNRIGQLQNAAMRPQIEAALAIVRKQLDPTEFAAAFAVGHQMPLPEAFSTILAVPSS